MKDEVKHLVTVDSQYQSKVLCRKLYKKFGLNITASNGTDRLWAIGVIDDGTLQSELFDIMRGYAMGILEWVKSIEASS